MLSARLVWSSVLGGAIAVLVTHAIGAELQILTSYVFWGLGAAAFFMCALLIGFTFPQATWAAVVLIVVGIAVGVIIDAIYQPLVNNSPRNLWPLGIMIWIVVGAVPIFIGFASGRMLGLRRKPNKRGS